MHDNSAILLIAAPDKKGLVYTITEFIYKNQGNLLHAEQHIDVTNNIFFMRLEWDLSKFVIPSSQIWQALSEIRQVWNMDMQLYFSYNKPKAAIFVSKSDHCLFDLLHKHQNGELQMDIGLIISNHENNQRSADFFNIPFKFFPILKENKEEQELQQLAVLAQKDIELVVLARYMQVLTPRFVDTYKNRIINVHHSFLPAFVGANPYEQAYKRGVKVIGSTAHYVTETLDDGPIISQRVVEVSHKDNLQEFVLKGKELEKLVLANAVKKHIERKILVFQNKTVVFD